MTTTKSIIVETPKEESAAQAMEYWHAKEMWLSEIFISSRFITLADEEVV